VTEKTTSLSNDAHRGGHEPPRLSDGTLPAPRAQVRELTFTGEELWMLRRFLSLWAKEEMLGAQPIEELVLAVNELATNSIRYGGGRGTLLLWREEDTLLCEVRDEGYIDDPLIGRDRPTPDEHSGRGLWLANQLCDLVEIRSSEEGTVVRVHMRLTGGSDEKVG
jgi:anti-sigma regulatory factor (Ser/Thr protein kinase)